MSADKNRYKQMEQYMTISLIADLVLLILFLIVSAAGIIWLKVVMAIITISLSALCLLFLYYSRELLRPRSLWMTTGAAAILICLVFSLILNFPSPKPY